MSTWADNVTYTFYSSTLGRAEIPDAATFDKFALGAKADLAELIGAGLVAEKAENGFASAACLFCECDYTESIGAQEKPVVSESVGGHSVSYDSDAVKSSASYGTALKMKWLKRFCTFNAGVK